MTTEPSAPPTDEELAARTRAGDEEAGRLLVERHRERLLGRARRRMPALLRRRVAASDVVQESLFAASNRLEDFEDRGPGSFGRWISRFVDLRVKQEIRDHLGREKRAAGREVSRGGRRSTHAFAKDGPTPSRIAGRREEEAQAVRALESLPDDYRRILRLVHEDGLTTAQAADALQRTPEAARKLYSRALARLADDLTPDEEGA